MSIFKTIAGHLLDWSGIANIPTALSALSKLQGAVGKFVRISAVDGDGIATGFEAVEKPAYTAKEIGADPAGTAASVISAHNTDNAAHNDLRLEVMAIREQLTAFLDVDEETLNELSELIAAIAANQSSIQQLTAAKVNVADIVDNLETNVSNKPLSAAMGVTLYAKLTNLGNSLSGYQPKGDYALNSAIPTKVSQLTNDKDYLARSELEGAVEDALTEAKESGEFDGPQGPAYELTEEDKAAITAAVVAALPQYAGEVEAV